MAQPVGVLFADLSLNSAAFAGDMGKARRSLSSGTAKMNRTLATLDKGFRRVGRTIASNLKGMVSLRGGIALVAGVAGLGLLVKRSLDTADAIAKAADAIGIGTAALQEYRFALDISGVAQEKTDKGLKKFVRNMGDLGRTSSETQTTLKDLDPALLANLRNLTSVEDQLQAAFRALASYDDQTKRAAVSASLFGARVGIDMTVGVKNGIAAFEDLRKKARDLGLIIDDKLLRGAEDAVDALTILGTVIKTKVTAAVVGFAPQIAGLAQTFTDNIPRIASWVESFARFVGLIDKTDVEKLADIEDRIKFIGSGLRGFAVDLGLFDSLKKELAELEARKRALLEKPVPPALVIKIPPPSPASAPTPIKGPDDKLSARMFPEGTVAGLNAAAQANADFTQSENEKFFRIQDSTAALDRQTAQTQRMIAATRQGEDAVTRVTQAIQLENEALSLGIDRTSAAGQAWERATLKARQMEGSLADLQARQQQQARQAEAVGNVMVSTLDRISRGYTDMKSLALGVLSDILRETLRLALAQRSLSFGGGGGGGFNFASVLSAGLGLLFGGGGSVAAAGISTPPTMDFFRIPTGGGGATIGAAHGVSFIVPGSGGTDSQPVNIQATPGERVTVETPAQQRRGGTIKIEFHQSFDFRGAAPGVFAEAQRFKDQIITETTDAVFDLIGQGGAAAGAVGRRSRA